MAMCCGILFLSSWLVIVAYCLIVFVVACSAFRHKAVCQRELNCRIAVGILEQSAAFYSVRVFHSVEFVAHREVFGPFKCYIQPLASLVFHAEPYRNIGCEAIVAIASGICGTQSGKDERRKAFGSALVLPCSVWPEVVFVGHASVNKRLIELVWRCGIVGIVCIGVGRRAFQLAISCRKFQRHIWIEHSSQHHRGHWLHVFGKASAEVTLVCHYTNARSYLHTVLTVGLCQARCR